MRSSIQETKDKDVVRKWFGLFWLLALTFPVWAQYEVAFTGRDNSGGYVQLHHIVVEDVTQGWTDTLFPPDTILLLSNVGVPAYPEAGTFALSQNTPNPFDGVTDFVLTLPQSDWVDIEVVDLAGRKVTSLSQRLAVGKHTFRVWLRSPQPYLLNVRTPHDAASLKMLNNGSGGADRIVWTGESGTLRSGVRDGHPHEPGDLFRITGYTLLANGNYAASEIVEQPFDGPSTVVLTFYLSSDMTVTTGSCTGITYHEAVCEGIVTSDGLLPVTASGICWGIAENPTLSGQHTDEGGGVGVFTSTLPGLAAGMTYHYRAYASNAVETLYGEDSVLTTLPNDLPTVTTASVTNNVGYSATCGGTVTDDGGLLVLEKGICWSSESYPYPTISGPHVVSTDTAYTFTCDLTGLTPNTNYYLRAYATNALGTSYGNLTSFQSAYLLTTHILSLSDTTNVSVRATGRIANGNPSYSAKGFCWSTSPNPTLADQYVVNTSSLSGAGNYSGLITGLEPGTTYYVRTFVTNIVGTSYSSGQKVFTTLALPVIETDSVVAVADSSVMTGGNILHNGSLPILAAGVCWSTSPNPTCSDSHISVSDTIGHFQLTLTDLSADSIYYLRAYATNSFGTSYGEEYPFRARVNYGQTCPDAPTVTDYDGNVYSTVQLGTQCWMAENLRTTHFADGTFIPIGTEESNYNYYRYYPNEDSSIVDVYGYHYNWKAAMHGNGSSNSVPSGIQGVCPDGWHLPSRAEWQALKTYISGQNQYRCNTSAASIGKSLASISGWQYYGTECTVGHLQEANNETGFNAYPAGGEYMDFGRDAAFWTSTAYYSTAYGGYSYLYGLGSASSEFFEISDYNQWYQWHSIRCLKN